MKRHKMSNQASKAHFTRNAGTHALNVRSTVMRGGIRL